MHYKGRELCRLNNLPPTTLSTTPHLLHTRSFLDFPPSAQAKLQKSMSGPTHAEEKEREVKRARERAEKRLQTVTKEMDWRVAKAYVALADDDAEVERLNIKRKEEGGAVRGNVNLEAAAVDRYMDDDEWEAQERRAGRDVRIRAVDELWK